MENTVAYTPEVKEIILKTLLKDDDHNGGIFSKIRNKIQRSEENLVEECRNVKVKVENVSVNMVEEVSDICNAGRSRYASLKPCNRGRV